MVFEFVVIAHRMLMFKFFDLQTDQRCIVKYNQPYSNMRHALENLLNQRTGRLELIINSNSDSNLVQVLQRNRTVSTLALHFSEAKSASDCVEIHCLNKFLEHLVSNTTISTLELKSTPQNRQFHSGKLNFIDCLPLNSCNLIGQILRSNSNIKYLEMRCNLADINGMFTIISGLSSKSSNITKMNLQGSFTELVILTSLCGFLESNTVITDINLSDCGIDSDEAASTIARVVQSNTSLVSLNISGCRFSAAGSKQIANALSTNTSLSWLDVSFNVEGRVSVVEVLSHGTYYRVPPAETGAVHFADSLIHNTSLQSLHLRGHFVSTETRGFIQALTQNITLTELSFPFFNQLHDHDELPSVIIEFIASTSSLKKIRFLERFSVNMSCALATVLQDRHFISDLDLSGCFFPLSSWNERNESSILVREMPTIGMVALFDSLHACPSLTRLRAQSIQEGNLFCRPNSHVIGKLIRQSKSITELDLSHSNCYLNFHLVADALKQNTSLISLNLANSAIGDSGAIALSAVMRENFVLKCLNVTNNSIGRHGIHSISQSLRQNSSLSHLLISSYDMPITDIDVLFSRKYLSQSNCHIDVGIEERL
jgi:Ran GTPase-activating protein (RanGAP) involved in mRNA processing and transport